MGTRAVIIVVDDNRGQRRFYAQHASKTYQIPHLARFLHWTDEHTKPLALSAYREYVTTFPNSLPGQDITDTGWYTTIDEVGDLDHRYELILSQTDRSFRYTVWDCDRCGGLARFVVSVVFVSRAELYAAAARMCDAMAAGAERYLTEDTSVAVPGLPSRQELHREAARFRAWQQETQAGPAPGPATTPNGPAAVSPVARFWVGQAVHVMAFGNWRAGTVTALGRTRVGVRFVRNAAGCLDERRFAPSEVAPADGLALIPVRALRPGHVVVLGDEEATVAAVRATGRRYRTVEYIDHTSVTISAQTILRIRTTHTPPHRGTPPIQS